MASVLDEIKLARERKGFSQSDVADRLGIGLRQYQNIEAGMFPKYKRQQIQALEGILGIKIYERIYEEKGSVNASEPEPTYQTKLNALKNGEGKKRVPLYDAPAAAGNTSGDMTPIAAPAGTIDVGDLLHDSQAAIRIYGNSMIPNYPPGCVVGLARCESKFIEPGEVYVIETRDRRILKRLFYKDDNSDGDFITCYSDNIMNFEGGARHGKLAYPPFDLPKSEIVKIFTVTGVIKRNANSIIINRN